MTGRIAIDAAKFRVAVAAVEARSLKAYRIETNPDATTRTGNLFSLREQK